MAAGGSTRLGSPKQLILYENQPLVRRAAIAALDAGVSRVVVVLGAHAAAVGATLSDLPSVALAPNPDWESGLASSLAVGIAAIAADVTCDAALVMLADQPHVDAEALRRLIEAFDDEHRIIASAYDETIGVPALFAREHFEDLMRLTGDRGAGSWLRSRRNEVTSVALRRASLDVDTPADVARLRVAHRGHAST